MTKHGTIPSTQTEGFRVEWEWTRDAGCRLPNGIGRLRWQATEIGGRRDSQITLRGGATCSSRKAGAKALTQLAQNLTRIMERCDFAAAACRRHLPKE